MPRRVIVIGGGAAGMMAASAAGEQGAKVTLVERNDRPGRKLYITGKGRCNVTNDCSVEELLESIPRNSRFLYSAASRFTPGDVQAWFRQRGVALKVERGNRVFPQSDRAADIIDALTRELRRQKVHIVTGRAMEVLTAEGSVTGVRLEDGRVLSGDRVILATGGASYPRTGSTGDGYTMARALGHTVTALRPSLVPLVAAGEDCPRMQGLSLRNVALTVKNQKKKTVYEGFGEMLFTHFGVSGPLILSASAHMTDFDKNHYSIIIDLKPALDEKKLDSRILRDFEAAPNREIQNVLGALLPRLMIPVVLERAGIPAEEPVNSVTKAQRRALLETVKAFRVEVSGPRPVEEAIVTAGGVKLKEVDPATMESKLVKGLCFAGELLDLDAYTGGFNLQIAWATGRAAGEAAGAEGT